MDCHGPSRIIPTIITTVLLSCLVSLLSRNSVVRIKSYAESIRFDDLVLSLSTGPRRPTKNRNIYIKKDKIIDAVNLPVLYRRVSVAKGADRRCSAPA